MGLHVKYPLFFSDCNLNWISWTNFRKILQFQNSYKSVELQPSWSIWTDRQIEMTKLTVAFSNFANTPTKLPELYTNIPLAPLSKFCVSVMTTNQVTMCGEILFFFLSSIKTQKCSVWTEWGIFKVKPDFLWSYHYALKC